MPNVNSKVLTVDEMGPINCFVQIAYSQIDAKQSGILRPFTEINVCVEVRLGYVRLVVRCVVVVPVETRPVAYRR